MEITNKLSRLFSDKTRQSNNSSLDRKLAISCQQFFTQSIEFRPSSRPDSHLEALKSRYKPLNKVLPPTSVAMEMEQNTPSGSLPSETADVIPKPRKVLYTGDRLDMEWKRPRNIGAGLSNMGNTCFLNSVLQCMTYTPPLVNYLQSGEHKQSCSVSGFCAMCEFHRHCVQVITASHGCVKPGSIVHNLRAIAKHFRLGRQEDAHEFLRYFIDGLQKSCLHGYPAKLDPHSKATTVVHQIFGGYHRSQVKCLECMKTSNTYDPLLDVSLDIKNCSSLTKALQRSIKPDMLEGDNCYACPYCKKMTRAQKRFTIQKLPRVLTFQLKRFDFNSMFGGKVNKAVEYSEHINMRPYMSNNQAPGEWYRLYAVLVHFGYSCHSGHYYCYVKNSNGCWYCMNDSQVSQVSLSTVLAQEAYLLFYIRDENHTPPSGESGKSQGVRNDPNFLSTPSKKPTVSPQRKPTGVVPPSPKVVTSSSKSSNGKITQEFSIPLKKATVPMATKPAVAMPADETTSTSGTSSEPPKHVFIPRQIKTPKLKMKGNKDKRKEKLVLPPSLSPLIEESEDTKEQEDDAVIPLVDSIQSPTAEVKEMTILDYAEPARFIGPLLPSSSHEDTSPLVALVSPVQPHSGSMLGSGSIKPVALVRPSPHVSEEKTEDKGDKEKEEVTPHTSTPKKPKDASRSAHVSPSHTFTPSQKHILTPSPSSPQVDSTTSGDVPASPEAIVYGPELSSDHVTSTLEQTTPTSATMAKPEKQHKDKRKQSTSDHTEASKVTSSRKLADDEGSAVKLSHEGSPAKVKGHKKHYRHTSPSNRGREHGETVDRRRDHGRSQSRSPVRSKRSHSISPHSRRHGSHKHRHRHRSRSGERVKRSRSRSPYRERVKSYSGGDVKPRPSGDSSSERVKHSEEERRLKKKKRKHSSGRGQSSSPEVKRHKSDSYEDRRPRKSVPEVFWDAHPKEGSGGVLVKWDGTRHSDVLQQLTSRNTVKSWAGGESSLVCGPPREERRGDRDDWDRELDRGKVKKVKQKPRDDFSSFNRFQQAYDRSRNGSGSHHHKSHKHHKPHTHHKSHKWHRH